MSTSRSAKVHKLLKEHPFVEDFLAAFNPKLEVLNDGMARSPAGPALWHWNGARRQGVLMGSAAASDAVPSRDRPGI